GLCLAERERDSALTWRHVILLALPALVVPINSVAALYCIGVAGILLFWGRLGAKRSWLPIMLMFCLFLGAWSIMGYGHAPDAAQAMIKEHVTWQWWTLAVWFMAGLGFRIVGFGWISQPSEEPLSALPTGLHIFADEAQPPLFGGRFRSSHGRADDRFSGLDYDLVQIRHRR